MNDKQNNLARMARTTCQYCDNHTSDTGGIPNFATSLASAKNKLTLIDNMDMIATGNSKGVTENVNELRRVMSDLGFKCGNAVAAYASSIHDNDLEKRTGYKRSAFDRLKKEEVDDICESILNDATTNSVQAQNFGMGAGDTSALNTAILVYRAGISDPRQKQISISVAKDQITSLLEEMMETDIKGQMDRMANTLKASNESFWKGYFKARVILDLSHTFGKVKGQVTDEDGNTLNGVLVTVKEVGESDIVGQATSAKGGKFSISQLNGDYDVTWSKDGFVLVSELNVHVGPGKEVNKKVEMKPV